MKNHWKPFVLGLLIGCGLVVGIAEAQQSPIIVPPQTLIVNGPNQPVPVRVMNDARAEPLPATSGAARTAAATIWEYQYFIDAADLRRRHNTSSIGTALDRMGAQGWEMVSPWVFKRPKAAQAR